MDDNEEVGRALSRWLAREHDLRWVGMIHSADSLADTVGKLAPDVVLLDIDMPGRDPLEALAELTARQAEVRVVILSGHVRRELIDRAFGVGAWGYLSKNDELGEIAQAIRRVMAGQLAMSADVIAAISS